MGSQVTGGLELRFEPCKNQSQPPLFWRVPSLILRAYQSFCQVHVSFANRISFMSLFLRLKIKQVSSTWGSTFQSYQKGCLHHNTDLDLLFLCDFFTDSTMGNHHHLDSPPPFVILPRNLTWKMKMMVSKRNLRTSRDFFSGSSR